MSRSRAPLLVLLALLLSAPAAASPRISDKDPPVAQGSSTTVLARGLENPWSMAWLPDGSMLLTERPGRVRVFKDGALMPAPIPGVPEVFASGQGGLLDVAAHPKFAENRLVYFTYAHGERDANKTRVARARFDGIRLTDWQVIFENSRTKTGGQHFGSRMAWLPDGTLLVSIGDGGNPPVELDGDLIRKQAQNLGSHFGKIIRITDDGGVPKDNPFVGRRDADPAVWSYGHRNIQGMAWDPINKRLWISEHGALGGDELNLARPGKNYGWPVVTFSKEYLFARTISKETTRPGMEDPALVWMTAIAPSGLAVYSGEAFPQWKGDLFAGGLIKQDIRRIKLDAGGRVILEEAIRMRERVRDVRQGPDGLLYVLTDEENGSLIRIAPSAPQPAAPAGQ